MKKDKIYHLVCSFAITLILSFIFGYLWAILLTLGIGVAKELWDYFVKDNFSVPDLKADATGIFFGVVAFSLIMRMIK